VTIIFRGTPDSERATYVTYGGESDIEIEKPANVDIGNALAAVLVRPPFSVRLQRKLPVLSDDEGAKDDTGRLKMQTKVVPVPDTWFPGIVTACQKRKVDIEFGTTLFDGGFLRILEALGIDRSPYVCVDDENTEIKVLYTRTGARIDSATYPFHANQYGLHNLDEVYTCEPPSVLQETIFAERQSKILGTTNGYRVGMVVTDRGFTVCAADAAAMPMDLVSRMSAFAVRVGFGVMFDGSGYEPTSPHMFPGFAEPTPRLILRPSETIAGIPVLTDVPLPMISQIEFACGEKQGTRAYEVIMQAVTELRVEGDVIIITSIGQVSTFTEAGALRCSLPGACRSSFDLRTVGVESACAGAGDDDEEAARPYKRRY